MKLTTVPSHNSTYINTLLTCVSDRRLAKLVIQGQIKILCGSLESLSYAVSTVVHLMTLYKEEDSVIIPPLLVSTLSCICLCIHENLSIFIHWLYFYHVINLLLLKIISRSIHCYLKCCFVIFLNTVFGTQSYKNQTKE